MKRNKLIFSVVILSLIFNVFYYFKLPDTVPVHFNASGIADRYDDKIIVFSFASLPLLFFIVKLIIPIIDKNKKIYNTYYKLYSFLFNFAILFLVGMNWLIISYALDYPFNAKRFLLYNLSLFLLIFGYYISTVKPNGIFGMKTFDTLNDDYVWHKVHKMLGILFIMLSILSISVSFFDLKSALSAMLFGLIATFGLAYFYSIYLSNRRAL